MLPIIRILTLESKQCVINGIVSLSESQKNRSSIQLIDRYQRSSTSSDMSVRNETIQISPHYEVKRERACNVHTKLGGKTAGNRDAPSHVLQLAGVCAEIYMFQLTEGRLKVRYTNGLSNCGGCQRQFIRSNFKITDRYVYVLAYLE